MSMYFGTTEITSFDNLAPATGLDITGLYFGDKECFTVWATYDGTLPATYRANGSALVDYRVYGSAGGVGGASPNMINVEPFKIDEQQSSVYISLYNGTLDPGTYTVAILQEDSITGSARNTLMVQIGTSNIYERPVDNYHNDSGWHYLTFTMSSEQSNLSTSILFWASTLNEDCHYSGAMLLNGSTVPTLYIPYGYEVDMSVQSENIMPSAQEETKSQNGIEIICDGKGRYNLSGTAETQTFIEFDIPIFTIPTSVGAGGNGTFSMFNDFSNAGVSLFFYNGNYPIDSWICTPLNRTHSAYNLMGGKVCDKLRFQISEGVSMNGVVAPMFTEDGALPTIFQPFGNTTTTIYIGSSPLGEDEYVDYESGKIYRTSGGVLTPTDPPVPLPALPTVDGVNIVDYVGQSAAVPSRFFAKYRKEGF